MRRVIDHPSDLTQCTFADGQCICGAQATQCETEHCGCCVTENRSPEPRCLLNATVTIENSDGEQMEVCAGCAKDHIADPDGQWAILDNPDSTETPTSVGAKVTARINAAGITASWEYPGCIQITHQDHCWVFGTVNGTWAAEYYESGEHYYQGEQSDKSIDTGIPAASTDVPAITTAILTAVRS